MPDMSVPTPITSPADCSEGERSSSHRARYGPRSKVYKDFGTVHNACVDGLLTDFYQITMAYAYWKNGKHEQRSVFDAYFRKCPFKGEYCIAGGMNEVVRFLNTFGYSAEQIKYLRTQMPHCDPLFFDYFATVDATDLVVYGMREGEIVFPSQPLLRLEGPLIICQLLETTLLNLLNFPSLITTNAARYRQAATCSRTGEKPILIEMGTRRAQGPDGALSASRYSYLGGFDATSNVKAGHVFGIPIKGTHAHAFVTSFTGLKEITFPENCELGPAFLDEVKAYRKNLGYEHTHDGELAAFISYAAAFPTAMLALVDTYDTLLSGIPNFLCVAMALLDRGFCPVGIRLDSGDLAYLSKEAKRMFARLAESNWTKTPEIKEKVRGFKVCASNDINETTLKSLNEQGHGIDIYGIGTNLVTCQAQPALGMVYKLVELDDKPRMKLSQEITKVSVPSRKTVYRLYNADREPLIDLMQKVTEPKPEVGQRIFCRHLFDETKRCYVTPSYVEELLVKLWDGAACISKEDVCDLAKAREYCSSRLEKFRQDILRPLNPTPYKLAVSNEFFTFFKSLWQEQAPIKELK